MPYLWWRPLKSKGVYKTEGKVTSKSSSEFVSVSSLGASDTKILYLMLWTEIFMLIPSQAICNAKIHLYQFALFYCSVAISIPGDSPLGNFNHWQPLGGQHSRQQTPSPPRRNVISRICGWKSHLQLTSSVPLFWMTSVFSLTSFWCLLFRNMLRKSWDCWQF